MTNPLDDLARLEAQYQQDIKDRPGFIGAHRSDQIGMVDARFRMNALQLAELYRPFAGLVRIEPQPTSLNIDRRDPTAFYQDNKIDPPDGYSLLTAPIAGIWYWQKEMKIK